MRSNCRFTSTLGRLLAAGLLLLAVGLGAARPAFAREAAAVPQPAPQHEGAQAEATGAHEEAHEAGWFPTIAKTFNFAVLVGVLVYFLREPLATYLNSRITRVREDLVTAASTREAATRQLADIQAKLDALPGELAALKQRGAEEIAAERARIEQAARTERERLLDQTRREIEMHARMARRELVEFAATQAVTVASDRIKRTITPADQARLVDRYAAQVQGLQP
ncbi:MAG TPA: ATP synthase F0 subunit B [Vicinamibacterales bacterium]|jgi:F-type H+-transporting ATPase subunit b